MVGASASDEEAQSRYTVGVESVAQYWFIFTKCPVSIVIGCVNTCLPIRNLVHKTHCSLFLYHAHVKQYFPISQYNL